MTPLRIALLAIVTATIALGNDQITLGMEPGCFTGPTRSLLTANADDGAWIQYANEKREWKERASISTKQEVVKVLDTLRGISFSEREQALLAELNRGIIGPGRYSLKLVIDDKTFQIAYLADMTLPLEFSVADYDEDERFAGRGQEVRSILTKVRTVHEAIEPLIPNEKPNKSREDKRPGG